MIILKVFTLSPEDRFLEKPQGRSNWHFPAFLGLRFANYLKRRMLTTLRRRDLVPLVLVTF